MKRIPLPTLALSIACAVLVLTAVDASKSVARAQEKPAAEPEAKPKQDPAPAEDASKDTPESDKPAQEKPEGDAPAEAKLPDFKNYEEIVAHFEPLRAEIQQDYEQKARLRRLTPDDVEKLNSRLKAIDEKFVDAVEVYVEKAKEWNPAPADLLPARRELVMFSSRFGEWEKTIEQADSFMEHHEKDDADSTREVSWLRADAISQIEGREEEAVKELAGFIENFGESFEAGMARMQLYRMYLYTDRVDSAKRLLHGMLELPEVIEDPNAGDFIATLIDNLGNIGEKLPDFKHQTPEGDPQSRANLVGKPFILWYWSSTEGVCLEELPALREVAKTWKNDLRVFPISVNGSKEAWKEFVDQEDESSNLLHRFEGNVEGEGDEKLSSTEMGFSVIPMTILVTAEGRIHRFDVPSPELERTVRAWLGEPTPDPEPAKKADGSGEKAPESGEKKGQGS